MKLPALLALALILAACVSTPDLIPCTTDTDCMEKNPHIDHERFMESE